jgi:hypothetical protein
MNIEENPSLTAKVSKDTTMKEWLVNYVGEDFKKGLGDKKSDPDDDSSHKWDGSVTVEMIVEKMSKDFPEFLMVIAEENWIRGYHQALNDVREGEKAYKQQLEKKEDVDEE